MAMTTDEARRIALDSCHKHATVTLDCAAMVLEREGELALRQLAEIKACLQRGAREPAHYGIARGIGN